MKKSMFASVKPLAMATAVAAGTSMSMIAVALPGGDTSGAAGVVNESICHNAVDMTIASSTRSVTTGTGSCQLRTLPPTKGLVLAESAPAGGTVNDSSALVNAGGESYETYVGGNRSGSLLLTPNRSLAVTRSSSFASGVDGSVGFDLGAAVQPATGLQSSWLTGTYNIVSRIHAYQMVASGLESSVYANPNFALGERNSTAAMTVTFNGDGTCDIDAMDNRGNFSLTKDPMMILGEMDNGCTVGGGNCGQNDGNNYVAMGNVNAGSTGSQVGYYDWNDANLDQKYGRVNAAGDCSYTVSGGVASVTYNTQDVDDTQPSVTDVTWTAQYNVSADLRYLVSAAPGNQGNASGNTAPDKGDIAIGVRVGAGDVTDKTYLVNMTKATLAASTPTTGSYENPASPTYQEEECITRGSIAFASGGTCTLQTVSSCTGRSKSGYEESTDGAADGTIIDSLTAADGNDAAPTSCSWTNAGGLVVSVGTTDPDSNPITVTYTGDVSDNGEALVLQGEYSIEGAAPDLENVPLLPQQKYNMVNFMVGQEYQGSLTADADADGATNYDEFVWAADVTPASGSVKNDYNGDGASDLMFSRTTDGQLQSWIVDPTTGTTVLTKTWITLLGSPWAAIGSGDFDANTRTDMLYQNTSTGQLQIMKFNAAGTGLDSKYWWSNALAPNTNWIVKGVGDFNGDGSSDVLWQRTTDGQVQVWLSSADGLTVATKAWLLPRATNWVIKGIGDMNGDGRSDVVWRDSNNGQMAVWIIGATGTTIDANAWLPEAVSDASGWVYQGLADTDGDGGKDIIYRRTSDGMLLVWLMAADGVARTSKNWIAPIATTWTIRDTGTDYNADGRGDVLFVNGSGQNQVWLMAADGFTKQASSWLSGPLSGWDYKPAN